MNKDLLVKGMIFLAGGAIGSVVTWTLVKTKYEQTIEDKNEEILFLRDRYSNKKDITVKDVVEAAVKEGMDVDISVQEIRDKVQELGYINEQVMKDKEREREDEEDMDRPEIIAPTESWEQDYPTLSLTYYEGDGVLANDDNEIIENVDELVGEDFADHFGEYEEDSVFVRNDKHGVYYEILRDYGCYSEND